MKKRAINKYLKSKNVIISSVIGVCLLAGGVSAFYVNNNSQRANVQEVVQSEETPTPSPTPEVETPAEVTTSPSITPTPSTSPTPAPTPMTYDDIYMHTLQRLNANWKNYGLSSSISVTKLTYAISQNSTAHPNKFTQTAIDGTIDACVNFYVGQSATVSSGNLAKNLCGY